MWIFRKAYPKYCYFAYRNQSPSYAINAFPIFRGSLIDYMSKCYFGDDCFQLGAEPELQMLDECDPPRKFSHDQVLPFLVVDQEINQNDNLTQESIKIKSTTEENSESSLNKNKKKRKNPKTVKEGFQRGHWNIEENKRYHWFLEIHHDHFLNKHLRRMDKIFKVMEKFVKCREAQQCRSHHQKMEKKYGSFSNILKALRKIHYGSEDSEIVQEDMTSNGISEGQQLLSWAVLESGIPEKSEQVESEKQTFNEIQEATIASSTFIDPLQEFQCDEDHFLEALICL